MPAKAPDSNLNDAIDCYVAGDSVEVCSRRFHTSYQRLRDALEIRGLMRDRAASYRIAAKRMGATRRAKLGLPDDEIVRRYLAGESEKTLATAFGVDRLAIRARLRSAGVVRRGIKEASQLASSKKTSEEHIRHAMAAHGAALGRVQSLAEKTKRAATREAKQLGVSPAERVLAVWLGQRGYVFRPQMAVGPYNVDLGSDAVAVEIFGGGWHAYGDHHRRARERYRYLTDLGLNLVIIWVGDGVRMPSLQAATADYIASFVEETRRDPSIRGQYRMIWGDGKQAAVSGKDIEKIAVIPSRRAAYRLWAADNNASGEA